MGLSPLKSALKATGETPAPMSWTAGLEPYAVVVPTWTVTVVSRGVRLGLIDAVTVAVVGDAGVPATEAILGGANS